MSAAIGATVRVVFPSGATVRTGSTTAVLLGEDEHGPGSARPAGTRLSRPGAGYDAPADFVSLVGRTRRVRRHASTASTGGGQFPRRAVELYVDITTVPVWEDDPDGGGTVPMVDLDLDVVRGRTGRVWVDDEDEFADHRVRFGYPADVVRLATTTCDRVHEDGAGGSRPYDGAVGRRLAQPAGCSPAACRPRRPRR